MVNQKRYSCPITLSSVFVILALLLCANDISARAQQSATLSIVLTQPLTDTGLQVTKDDFISVTASGTMNWYTGGCNEQCISTPDGEACPYTGFYAQGLACWSLIGQIGDGAPFQVGTSLKSFAAPNSGKLYLGVNDNNYPDNTGAWTAMITLSTVGRVQIRMSSDTTSNPLTFIQVAPTVSTSFRPNHNPLQLYAACFDGSSNTIPNCQITVSIKPVAFSGGHEHDSAARPPGELATTEDDLSDDGYDLDNLSISLQTDNTGGPAPFYYLASPVGGDVQATVKATANGFSLPDSAFTFYIRTLNASCPDPNTQNALALCPLLSGPTTFVLTGYTPIHPVNHYGTPGFLLTLPEIAKVWYFYPTTEIPVPPLAINDLSLVGGGDFDLNSDWETPHKAHKWGDEADIGSGGNYQLSYWIPKNQRLRLLQILQSFGYRAIIEQQLKNKPPCDPNKSSQYCNHFHIRPAN